MAVRSKPLLVTVVAVTAQMIAPLVTMIALASARDVIVAVVAKTAAVVAIAARVVIVAVAKIVAMVVAKAVVTVAARVAATAARRLPVMAVLPKLASALWATRFTLVKRAVLS